MGESQVKCVGPGRERDAKKGKKSANGPAPSKSRAICTIVRRSELPKGEKRGIQGFGWRDAIGLHHNSCRRVSFAFPAASLE